MYLACRHRVAYRRYLGLTQAQVLLNRCVYTVYVECVPNAMNCIFNLWHTAAALICCYKWWPSVPCQSTSIGMVC